MNLCDWFLVLTLGALIGAIDYWMEQDPETGSPLQPSPAWSVLGAIQTGAGSIFVLAHVLGGGKNPLVMVALIVAVGISAFEGVVTWIGLKKLADETKGGPRC